MDLFLKKRMSQLSRGRGRGGKNVAAPVTLKAVGRTKIMTNTQWQKFFQISRETLGRGSSFAHESESWCAWTTFTALHEGVHYWTCGLPDLSEIEENHIADGGTWGQTFPYNDLAHVVIPKSFYWETEGSPEFKNGFKKQKIEELAVALKNDNIPHRLAEYVLEVKLY